MMDGMNVKSLEERSEGDVASPSSTGTQVQSYTRNQLVHKQIYYLNSQNALFQDSWGWKIREPVQLRVNSFILHCLVSEQGCGGLEKN